MAKTIKIQDATQVAVSDKVKFVFRKQVRIGHISKKGSKYAYIVCSDGGEFKVPYRQLYKYVGAQPKHVLGRVDKQRLQFQVNDRVSFEFKREVVEGVITRLNPKRAHIVCGEGAYQVAYTFLTLTHRSALTEGKGANRDEAALRAIDELARSLLGQYGLSGWSFQFDHSSQRAGCCDYGLKVISLAYAYARQEDMVGIRDTILHEIAHALVGQEHHHDEVWRAKALEIGCSGERCHDVQFSPPRYTVRCENGCWETTRQRRRRGAVCKSCGGRVVYRGRG